MIGLGSDKNSLLQTMLRISSSSGCDTGDEWFPNRDEAAEGPTEETKGGQPTVLDFSSCLHSYSNALVEKQKKTTVFFFCLNQPILFWTFPLSLRGKPKKKLNMLDMPGPPLTKYSL